MSRLHACLLLGASGSVLHNKRDNLQAEKCDQQATATSNGRGMHYVYAPPSAVLSSLSPERTAQAIMDAPRPPDSHQVTTTMRSTWYIISTYLDISRPLLSVSRVTAHYLQYAASPDKAREPTAVESLSLIVHVDRAIFPFLFSWRVGQKIPVQKVPAVGPTLG